MSAPDPRELRRAAAILKALGMALIYVPGDKWAIEQAGSPGAGRWPVGGAIKTCSSVEQVFFGLPPGRQSRSWPMAAEWRRDVGECFTICETEEQQAVGGVKA